MPKRHPYAQMTKKFLEEQGYIVGITEHWNPFAGNKIPEFHKCPNCQIDMKIWKNAGVRMDLFEFSDLIIFRPNQPDTVLVQCTSGTNHSHRKQKIIQNGTAMDWMQSEYRGIMIVSWTKKAKKKRDGTKSKQEVWTPRIDILSIADFDAERDPF